MKLKITILLSLLVLGFGLRSLAQSPITSPSGLSSVCVGNTLILSDADPAGTWTSSATTVATVTLTTGSVTGVTAGTSIISYSSNLGVSTFTVTVVGIPTAITGPSNNVCESGTLTLTETVSGGTWVSSNTTVATIATAGTAVNATTIAGTTTITYDNGCGSVNYTVNVLAPVGIINGLPLVCVGNVVILTDAVSGGTWSSSATTVATVGTSGGTGGYVSGVSAGAAVITYTNGCAPAQTFSITVQAVPVAITGSTHNICIGATVALSESVTGGTWSSSSTVIATILPAGTTATGVSTGTINITYSNSCGAATYNINVLPTTAAITSTVTTLCSGSSTTLSDPTPGGTWSSSSVAIATVTNGLVVAGTTLGVVTISYSNGCGIQTYSLTVLQAPGPITGLNGFCQGSTAVLTSTPAGGVWSSDNTTVATINSSTGVLLGLAIGNAAIFYTLADGCATSFPINISNCPACPINSDFELGDYSIWHYYTGTCCPGGLISAITPVVPPATTPNRFMLMNTFTAPTADPYGGFPTVGAGLYSLRIGTCQTNYYASKAIYYVHVPTGTSNYSLIYRYAVVMEDPGHAPAQQPRFTVTASDSTTGVALPCAFFNYVAGSLPGFVGPVSVMTPPGCTPNPGPGNNVYYKPWATTSINLAGLGGHTISMAFAAGDCDAGGHWGYGYVDMTCGTFAISSIGCGDSIATVSAPAGFANYAWYDSLTFTTLYGTTQTVTFPMPTVPTTYAVIMTPFTGFGCPDTLYTRISPSNLQLHKNNDTMVCKGGHVLLNMNATDIALPLTYSWSPASNLSCTTCATPISLSPAGSTAYIAIVTDAAGCSKTDSIKVFTDSVAGIVTTTPTTCFGTADGSATVTPTSGKVPYTYSWNTVPAQTTAITSATLPMGTYSVTITDSSGCKGTAFNVVAQPPVLTMSIAGSSGPTTCGGTDGKIVLGGLTPLTTYTVTYKYNGTVVSPLPSFTSTATGTDTITGVLLQGSYDSIMIVGTVCPYNELGPVVLTDPAPPALPFVSSNSPVCVGNTLTLTTSDVTAGVTYQWSGPAGFADITQTPTRPGAAPNYAGYYVVTVTAKNCKSKDSTLVVINPNPQVTAAGTANLCSGDTLFLTSSSDIGADNYVWNGPNSFTSNLENPFIINAPAAAAGTYTVTITYKSCVGTGTADVVVTQSPAPPVVTDTNYCQGDNPVPPITANGSNLLWYSTATSWDSTNVAPIPVTTTPGIFTWYVTQRNDKCVSQRAPLTVGVYTLPNPTFTLTDSVFCRGSNFTFTVNDANTGVDYEGTTWSFSTGDSIQNVNPLTYAFNDTGVILVSANVYYRVCPDAKLSHPIRIYPFPVLHFGADTAICPGGDPITIRDIYNGANPNASWTWSTGDTMPYIVVTAPGTYYSTVKINGCTTSDTIVVNNDCYMSMPNVFTPNGDGVNDYFFTGQYLTRGLTSFSMNIYNRWGQLVFTTTSIDGKGWDGAFNATPQPEGVFVYIIDATFKDGQREHHQGNVTLLR